ncbi:MAG: hypothetical protein ACRCZI_11105 [Cetobacterium sp.]
MTRWALSERVLRWVRDTSHGLFLVVMVFLAFGGVMAIFRPPAPAPIKVSLDCPAKTAEAMQELQELREAVRYAVAAPKGELRARVDELAALLPAR